MGQKSRESWARYQAAQRQKQESAKALSSSSSACSVEEQAEFLSAIALMGKRHSIMAKAFVKALAK